MGALSVHSHKYDPFSQAEYFEIFDIFNQSADRDRPNDAPLLTSFSRQQQEQQAAWQEEILQLEPIVAGQREAARPLGEIEVSGRLEIRYVRVQAIGESQFLHLAEVEALTDEKNIAIDGVAQQSSTDFGGPAARAIDGNRDGDYQRAASTTHTAQESNPWWEVDLREAQPVQQIVVWNRTDSEGVKNRLNHYRVIALDAQHQPVWASEKREVPDPSHAFEIPSNLGEMAETDRRLVNELRRAWTLTDSAEAQRLAELQEQLKQLKPAISTPVMSELPAEQQRETFVHIRGDFRRHGEQVTANVPDVLPAIESNAPIDRRSFADWLVDERHPLTARVVVNRYWEQLFGRGLVETSEDFGTQGSLPSHPQLLDWLAVELIDGGWNGKQLVREIVMSRTYRQSSQVSAEKLEIDPHNEWMSRGPRFRLTAEMVRDQALACGGLLSHKMRGPSVRPPRPNLGIRAAFGGSTDWEPSAGEDRFRRGLYTVWRRTSPYPSMTTFDATSREVCTVRRIRTNTPLQALVTLNDPVYLEAAQGLARRMMSDSDTHSDDRAKCELGFRVVLIRPPSDDELSVLVQLLQATRSKMNQDLTAAQLLATDPLGPLPEGVDTVDAASFTVLANVLLNLDETLARP